MNVLGIETATTVCASAVVVDGSVAAEAMLDRRNVHAEKLLTLVDEVLRRSGKKLQTLDGIAVSIGPGSFTGLRIGLSVAKGLAYAVGRALIAVPTLEALVSRIELDGTPVTTDLVVPMLDARRDEVYCQFFVRRGEKLLPEGDARDLTLSEMVTQAGRRTVTVIGDAHQKLASFLEHLSAQDRQRFRFIEGLASQCSAVPVALIGERLLKEGRRDAAATLEPRYIKEFFLAR